MNRKVFLSVAVSALALSACNTGTVQVDNGSAAGTTAPGVTAAPVSAAPVTPINSASPTPPPADKQQPTPSVVTTAYFERVQVRDGLPFDVIAIGFISTTSTGEPPFGVSLQGVQPFSSRPIFVPGSNQVTYVKTVDVGMDALLSTSLDALNTQQLLGFPSEVKDFSLDSKKGFVTWLSDDGGIFISNLTDGSQQTLDISSFPANVTATQLQTDPTSAQILALANNGTGYFYKSAKDTPSLISDITAAAFSPDGTQLVYLNSSDKALHLIELDTMADTVAGHLESGDIHDLSWSISGGISYWTRLTSGQKEIRTLNAGIETTITQLTLPDSVGNGVVCPSWKDGTVYFANDYAGAYAIEQVDTGKRLSKAMPLAQVSSNSSISSNEGFVCPKVQ